jgi:hypothetical protein
VSDGYDLAWLFYSRPQLTEDEIFAAWLTFGGGWTLDEFRTAYLKMLR